MNCNICGSNAKLVPAGISKKNGKPYNAFYSCTQQGCRWTKPFEESPKSPQNAPQPKESAGEILKVLESIDVSVKAILAIITKG